MIVGGALTIGGPMMGVLGTVLGMIQGFGTLEKAGVADPAGLASNIGVALVSTFIGIGLGGIGVVVLIVGFIMWQAGKSSSTSPPPLQS